MPHPSVLQRCFRGWISFRPGNGMNAPHASNEAIRGSTRLSADIHGGSIAVESMEFVPFEKRSTP
ncbi:MAG: hypothetical protein KGQ51_03175 [Planctomycetes bacterium]|nr:hypothetical protein [Planctomycetota bacterium]